MDEELKERSGGPAGDVPALLLRVEEAASRLGIARATVVQKVRGLENCATQVVFRG